MKKTIVIVYDGAVINGGAAKIAIQSAVELAKNPDINMIYFAANAEVDECLQSNDAIKVVCIDTPHIASNKNKIKASLYGIWNRKAKTEFAKLLLDLDPKHTVISMDGVKLYQYLLLLLLRICIFRFSLHYMTTLRYVPMEAFLIIRRKSFVI